LGSLPLSLNLKSIRVLAFALLKDIESLQYFFSLCLTEAYLRLSKEDGDKVESDSIATQKAILERYCKEHKIGVFDMYIDDGWSGMNFRRPAFQRMKSDIEAGKIMQVITKDLSRLGREYLETGMYIEIFFANYGVQYIAVNDNVDSKIGTGMDIMPFKNLINDMSSKDTSKKVKTALIARQKQGKFIGNKAPYGYKKDPNDKNHLVIDERFAPVVRKIFTLAKDGLGIAKIRKILTEEKIPRPAASANDDGHNMANCNLESEENRCFWSNNSVRDILRNPVYAGHIAGQKRPKVSMKSEKRERMPSDKYFVVEDCHEPIITPDEWRLVQDLITSRSRGKMGSAGYENIFAGIVKCETCGYAMTAAKANRRKRPDIIDCVQYSCNNYRTYGTSACTIHACEARDLHDVVLADIQKHAELAVNNDRKMAQRIAKQLNLTGQKESSSAKKELAKSKTRLAELDRLFAKLYEDRAAEEISEYNYKKLSANYEREQIELERKIGELEQEMLKNKVDLNNAELFITNIKECAEITELSAALLNRLIDKITISEREMIDGEVTQKITIYYKFIGNFT